ncbi:MAG: NusG domain II-containing protein [Ectothiorhodospiraceae bacterium]
MTRIDGLILALAVIGVGALYATLWGGTNQAEPRRATVQVAGETVLRLDLSKAGEHQVTGPLGTTRIRVRDGRVRVTASPGPRKLCVRRGWLRRPGATAVCLPNQVVVAVAGDNGLDGTTY